MFFNLNRAILFLLLSTISMLLGAQSLYWVGGSGNFNDPGHWSLSSGGPLANQVPNAGTDVIFDDKSLSEPAEIDLGVLVQVRSLRFLNYYNNIKLTHKSITEFRVGGEILLSGKVEFADGIKFSVKSRADLVKTIDFAGKRLNADFDFVSGKWNLESFDLDETRTARFLSGQYTIDQTYFYTGNFLANTGSVSISVNQSIFRVANVYSVTPANQIRFNSSQLEIDLQKNKQAGDATGLTGSNNRIIGGGNSVAACGVTLTGVTPLCGAGTNSTGSLFISIDPTCAGTYTLQFISGCAPLPPTVTVTAGQSFTLNGFASCGTPYQVVIIQGGVPIAFSAPFLMLGPTPVVFFPFLHVSPSCFNQCNGSFSASWSNGTSPYTIVHVPPSQPQYTSSGVVNPSIISYTGVCAGVHTFSVTDANGCSSTFTTSLTQPSALSASFNTTSVTCNSFSNGAFAVSPSGGTPNYSVNFSAGPQQTVGVGGTVTTIGLPAGPISATITDANACTFSVSSTILQPTAALSIVPSQTNVSCNGGNNGAASALVSGGTPTYAFVWSGSASTTSLASALNAGIKTVTVTDQNGCVLTQAYNISQPSAILLTPTSTNVVCNTGATGVISIAPSGGTGAFSFTWVAPGPSTISTGSTAIISTLTAGSYSIFASDANLCTSSVVVTLTQPPAVTLTALTQSITCLGLNNGGATVTAAGGNGGPFTFLWAPGGQTTNTLAGLSAGNYTATASDASSCPTQTVITITQPATSVTPISTFTNLTCNAGNAPCNGIITASPTGGVPPYNCTLTILGTTLTTAPPYTNLCAGTYTLDIKDASGCPQQTVNTLSQPALLTAGISAPALPCFNSSVTVTGIPAGGTPGYTLNWITPSGAASGTTINNQIGGNYTLTVSDLNGCTAQTTTLLTTPPVITITVNTPSISCFNVCNATLNSTVSGGVGGYNYAWVNSVNATVGITPSAINLCPGNYTLNISDANSCTSAKTATVLSPSAILLTQSTTPVSCSGNANGSATITASGGTPGAPAYTFSIPTATNNSGIFNGLAAGPYVATVLDAAGCTQTIGFNIATPAPLTANITGTIGSCNASNGSATVTAAGGNGGYTYNWAPAGGSASVASSLAPGNYTVTVTDVKSCTASATASIAFIVNVTVTPIGAGGILCNGSVTGQASVNVSGGSGPYSFTWTAGFGTTLNTQAVNTLSGNVVYTVIAADSSTPSSCSNSSTIQINSPPAMTITTSQTMVTCFGFTNGAISATLSGGTPPLSGTWTSPPPTSTSTAANSIFNLHVGVYTLNVRDFNLCPAQRTVNITSPTSITVTFTNTNPTGCLSNNGSICATASGGSGAGYTYSLSPPNSTNAIGCFSGLGGGAYSMKVTDGSGCNTTSITSLTNPTSPTLSMNSVSVACNASLTGVITVTASGSSPFTFSISPAPGATVSSSPNFTASGLGNGVYFVTAVDNNSCSTTQTLNIAQPSSLTLNGTPTNLLCNGISTGSITVAPSGATPGYTYSWLPAASITSGQGTQTVTGLAAGNYTLNITDANNCLTQHTFTLTQPSAIAFTATTHSLACNSNCNGSITVVANGGTGALNYSWTAAGGGTLSGSATNTVSGLCANTVANPFYSLAITDNNTCTASGTFTLTQPSAITATVNVLSPSCSNSCNAVATVTANGGTPTYSFAWSSSPSTASTLGALCSGNYSATVIDANGCSTVTAFTVTAPAAFSASLTPVNPLCNNSCNGSITSTLSGAQGTVSYLWSPGGSTVANPGSLCASPTPVYTLVATDQNACQASMTATLVNPPAMVAAISGTNPSCHSGTNGIAAVSVTNAVGATTFSWSAGGQTTQVASGLSPNLVYTVFVTDNNACTTQQTVSLIDPPSFTVNSSVATTSCGASNGSISVNVSGGTPGAPSPYTYTWTGPGIISVPQGQGTPTIINLPAGAYSVQIADGPGCTTTVGIAVANSNGPVLPSPDFSSVTCFGGSTGQASLNPAGISGGTPGYTISWGPAPSYTSLTNPITNLVAGFYQVRVIDANGCISFTNVTIAEPSSLTVNSSINAPLCNGVCDGSIALTPTGGIAPYSYTWTASSGAPLPNSSSLTSLCAGDYTVLISYNGICSEVRTFTFANQNSISIVPSLTNNACFGDLNGAISLTVGGGASPYNISWSNSQSGLAISNLANGSYTAVVTDLNNCHDTIVSTISSAPQMSLATSITSPSCGINNGAVTTTVSGGTAPFTYTWSNSATTPSLSGLGAGIYVLSVTDNSLCTQSQTVIINNSNGITGENINVLQIPCSGTCSGAATITPIGGNPPININWLAPPTSGSVISNLCPGTYFVQMTDAHNCVRSASVVINPIISLSITPFITPPSCSASNGSVNVVVSGGSAPYTYTWMPSGLNTPSLGNLGAGSYTLMVTESSTNNCTSTHTISLSNPGGPSISSTLTPNLCFNSAQGAIITVGSSTVPGASISYNWSNGSSSSSITGLSAPVLTVYNLTVSSTSGTVVCRTIQSFSLLDPPQLILNAPQIQHPSCSGICDGSISVQALGGTSPYTYTWSNAGNGASQSSLCTGPITLSLSDGNGCTFSPVPVYTLVSQSSISVAANSFSSSCSATQDGSASIAASGGVPSYSYTWQGPNAFTSTLSSINNIYSGTYTYNIIDSIGCTRNGTLVVAPTITIVAEAGADTIACPGTATVVLNGIGSTGVQTYKWYKVPDLGTVLSNSASLTVENQSDASLYILVVTSSVASCFDQDSVFIDMYTTPSVDAGTHTVIPVDATVTLGGSPTGATAVSYTWVPQAYVTNSAIANPASTNTFNVVFTVTVEDARGCIASDTVRVDILPEIIFANAFSPNGDQKNDIWIIDYIDQFPGSTVEIYNRWGERLYQTEDYPSKPFNGKFKEKDLPVGTYYYIINLKLPNNKGNKQFTGPLTIFR
ncbi:MAG TPA: gliding motility-associated C-terminal domain-containing protein [Bacteroidia bacterium]|nr:gliding motility-associated C-terminal domain-containing protein [Bacteroidia bacterium]